jgi:type II secretory pathway component PulF
MNDSVTLQQHTHLESTDVTALRASEPTERAVLRVLAIAHRHQISPVELLENLAKDLRNRNQRSKVKQLASAIRSGVQISEAIGQVPGVIQPTTCLALRLSNNDVFQKKGSRGQLAQTFRQLLDGDELSGEDYANRSLGTSFLGTFTRTMFCLFLISFLMIFVMPTFEKMFVEFGLRLPAPTQWLFVISSWLADYGALIFMIFFWIYVIQKIFKTPRFRAILSERGGRLLAWRKVVMPDVARLHTLLAIAMESNAIERGIATLSVEYPKRSIRSKLARANQKIGLGASVWSALREHGLLSARETKSLASASSPETQVWLLRWSARERQDRKARWSGILRRSVSIFMTCLLAVVVGFTSVAVFMPLVSLISGLS